MDCEPDLRAIHDSMHDPRRLIPFLARRGQIMIQYRAKGASGISGNYIASVGAHAKALIIEKIYTSVIEKVGLPFLQGILDATIAPYANELLRLQRLQEEDSANKNVSKTPSPKIVFKGAKVKYATPAESPTIDEIKSDADSIENCWRSSQLSRKKIFFPRNSTRYPLRRGLLLILQWMK